jgi:hypothetical protein
MNFGGGEDDYREWYTPLTADEAATLRDEPSP